MSAEVLFNDPISVVAGSRSRWSSRRSLDLAELMDELWVLPRADAPASAIIADTFQACGLELPRAAVVCNSIQLQNALLATGPFLTLLPRSLLRFGAKRLSIKVLPVKLPALHGPVGMLTLKNRTPSPVARLFIDGIREMAKPLAAGLSARPATVS
jgi:DNA-binding transcriptional LysR family regulator